MIDIKNAVVDNGKVVFNHYFDGSLWYTERSGITFEVPISDIGTATFRATDKAILFMRYMRKHNTQLESNAR